MKHPKIIYYPNQYPISIEKVSYTEYKYHGKVEDGCYEYISWWKNSDGKWKAMKIYFEKGNRIYREYQEFLRSGNDESGWSCKFKEFDDEL